MHLSTPRRFIVTLALLSHLLAAFFVHVPMAYAGIGTATAGAESAASEQPCPDHMKMHAAAGHTSDANSQTKATGATDASGHPKASNASTHDNSAGCKSGPCKCHCAHAQALTIVPMLTPALVAHPPTLSHYRVPLAPDCATSFFRPPI